MTAQRAARVITEICTPAVLVVTLLLGVGAVSTSRAVVGLGWGAAAALFAGIIPYGIVLLGVRRGRLNDHHIIDRSQRVRPMLAGLMSVAAGVAFLWTAGAPRQVLALTGTILVVLLLTIAITSVWKISAHATVASATVAVLMVVFGPVLAVAGLVVAAVGWSRVHLREHTLAQVLAGAGFGAGVAGPVFALIR